MAQDERTATYLMQAAILLTFIKLPFVIKIFVLSIVEWPVYTGFTVLQILEAPTKNHKILTSKLTPC